MRLLVTDGHGCLASILVSTSCLWSSGLFLFLLHMYQMLCPFCTLSKSDTVLTAEILCSHSHGRYLSHRIAFPSSSKERLESVQTAPQSGVLSDFFFHPTRFKVSIYSSLWPGGCFPSWAVNADYSPY